jgi:excisionase family DNA binding protein
VSGALLTMPEVAEELSCSLATVKRRVRSGALPVVRDGRIVRVRTSDLERYLLERVERRIAIRPPEAREAGVNVKKGARLWD